MANHERLNNSEIIRNRTEETFSGRAARLGEQLRAWGILGIVLGIGLSIVSALNPATSAVAIALASGAGLLEKLGFSALVGAAGAAIASFLGSRQNPAYA